MAGPIEIDVWQGELSELEVDALVVPANEGPPARRLPVALTCTSPGSTPAERMASSERASRSTWTSV